MPAVTVLTVVDFDYEGSRTTDGLKATLAALAAQDYQGPVEFLLLESEDRVAHLPPGLERLLPGLQIRAFPAATSYELMNAGVRAAAGDVVALIDGDCIPGSGWLRSLVDTLHAHPEVVAVTGLTIYGSSSFRDRVMGLLLRAYVNPGREGATRFFSNNNGGMRRSVWLRHPLPVGAGPYASRVQTEAIWRDGGRFWFQPRMHVVHDYEGWVMERDIRRHHGFCTVMNRRLDPEMPHAWLVRLGFPAIPAIVAGKLWHTWGDCLRCARFYNVGWHELPAAMALAIGLHVVEIPGMVNAFAGRPITRTRYR